jgi:hypothetical protein
LEIIAIIFQVPDFPVEYKMKECRSGKIGAEGKNGSCGLKANIIREREGEKSNE